MAPQDMAPLGMAPQGMEPLAFGTLPSRLPRIGGMATMPSRHQSLLLALPHILPQLDRLYLYLDQHSEVPAALAGHPKLVPLLPSAEERPLRGSGKFLGLLHHPAPCLYFGFDDDIIYGDGYVSTLVAALRRHQYRSLVGLHAAALRVPCASYIRGKAVTNFADAVPCDSYMDELGTGTMGFHSRCIRLNPRHWAHNHMDDLMVMLAALHQGVPRVMVRREAGLARPIEENQADSIFTRTMQDDSEQTRLVQAAMAHYPGAWCLGD